MIDAGDLRSGKTVERHGQLLEVLSFEHIKLGRGTAVVRARLRNVDTGAVTEETFRPEERLARARIERIAVQYLYRDGDHHVVMDTTTFEQYPLSTQQMGEALRYLLSRVLEDPSRNDRPALEALLGEWRGEGAGPPEKAG